MNESNPIQIATQRNTIFKVKDQFEAIFCHKDIKKEFYMGVQNSSPDLMKGLKITITSPDQIRIGTGIRGLGNILVNKEKFRSFSIIPKENGKFTINATLLSGKTTIATLPIEVRVGPEFHYEILDFKGNSLEANPGKNSIVGDNSTEIYQKEAQISRITTCPLCYEKIEPDSGYCKYCETVLN